MYTIEENKDLGIHLDLSWGKDNMFGGYDSVWCSTGGGSPLDQAAKENTKSTEISCNVKNANALGLRS